MDLEKTQKAKKILIVDDEEDIRTIVAYQLQAAGYEVIAAKDGEEGLQKARTESPNLMILDVMLPKIDGYKVCRLLKNDSRYRHMPIILFTAMIDQGLGKEAGADAYMTKPFETESLMEKIEGLLRK